MTPAMGLYLNMQGNDKGSLITGTHANENYAREIQQLFSIGLNRLWPDGSLVMDSTGNLVPTYDQNVIMGFAAAFTGWNYYQPNQGNGRLPTSFSPSANYTNPMVLVPTHHDLNTKLVLDNVVLPQAWGSQADPSSTNFDAYCSQDLELGPEFHLQPPERRPVHLPPAHSAAGDQQSQPGLPLSSRAGLQRQRRRRPRRYAGRHSGHPARLRSPQPGRAGRRRLRQTARTVAARHCRRRAPSRRPPR